MNNIDKINLKIISHNDTVGSSKLEFKISGNNIDYIIINTIRRTILNDIPIYAFNEFKFDNNKSNTLFHNNYLKLRFKNLPIWNIENNIDFFTSTSELEGLSLYSYDKINYFNENNNLNDNSFSFFIKRN